MDWLLLILRSRLRLMCSSHLPTPLMLRRFFDATVSSLTGPPGFAPIGSLPGPSDIVSRDFSSMIQPGSLSQLGPLPTRWAQPVVLDTGVVDDMLPSALSPITHDSLVEPVVAGVPFPLAPVDPDDDSLHLGFLLNQSFRRSLSPTSVQSDGTFYSATDIVRQAMNRSCVTALSWVGVSVGRGPLWRQTPTRALGTISAVVPTGAQHTGTRTLPLLLDSLVCRLTTHGSWSGWERWNLLAYWNGIPSPGSGSCPGYRPSTWCASCIVMHVS